MSLIAISPGDPAGIGPEVCLKALSKNKKHYKKFVIIVDIDPEFSNTEEWYQSIPEESRPRKDQPFYHLLAENSETFYSAYVSQQNLIPDSESGPIHHPDVDALFCDVLNEPDIASVAPGIITEPIPPFSS